MIEINNINDLINEIYRTGSIYNDICYKLIQHNYNDIDTLLSILCIDIYNRKEKMMEIYNKGEFKYFFIRMVINQTKSVSSQFYKATKLLVDTTNFTPLQYDDDSEIQHNFLILDDYELELEQREELITAMSEARNLVLTDWFSSEMFKMYYDENMTYREIGKYAGVDYNTVYYYVSKNLESIKRLPKIKHLINMYIYNKDKV